MVSGLILRGERSGEQGDRGEPRRLRETRLIVARAPFGDLTAANAAAAAWCAEVNGATHSEICAVPVERLATERELMTGLPSLRPSIGRVVARKVDRLSCVGFGSARYSVPTRLIGTEVGLRTDDGRLLVIVTATGQVVAEHTLVAPGEASGTR
jgi:hypothetical protein